MSTEWYTRLEKGHIAGVSQDVLDAVARALQLDEDERTYLFDLASAAQPGRTPRRRKAVDVPPRVQWLLDSMTLSAAFVTNGRLDIVASNALARALFAPLFGSEVAVERGRPNFARYWFLDRGAPDFVGDWDGDALNATVALLRAEAGRYPHDKALRELIGELSTVSTEFRTRWASHDVRIHHGGSTSSGQCGQDVGGVPAGADDLIRDQDDRIGVRSLGPVVEFERHVLAAASDLGCGDTGGRGLGGDNDRLRRPRVQLDGGQALRLGEGQLEVADRAVLPAHGRDDPVRIWC